MLRRLALLSVIAVAAVIVLGCQGEAQYSQAAKKPAVKWSLLDCQAKCPHCDAVINVQTDTCSSCKKTFVWKYPEFMNTPDGLMDKRKTAVLYQDQDLYMSCLLKADVDKMKYAMEQGMGFNQMVPRDMALAEVSRNIVVDAANNSAVATISRSGGATKQIHLVMEDGVWKMMMVAMNR